MAITDFSNCFFIPKFLNITLKNDQINFFLEIFKRNGMHVVELAVFHLCA